MYDNLDKKYTELKEQFSKDAKRMYWYQLFGLHESADFIESWFNV